MRAFGGRWLAIAVHPGCLLPFALLVWDYSQHHLTANPIEAATIRTGRTALVLLFLSLACSPANAVLRQRSLASLRRVLGLYAFGYAVLHFLIFVGWDYGFDLELIREGLFEKRFALAGLSSFLVLAVLAATSTAGWMRRLGGRWKRLHRVVYLAALLAVVHYLWSVKVEVSGPLLYGLLLLFLLMLRLPAVRRRLRVRTAA